MKILDVLPSNIEDMMINRTHAENVYKILEPLDMSIIIYGVKDSGKKCLVQCVMNTMFPHRKISDEPMIVSASDDEKLMYKLNNYYIEINCNSVRSKNKQTIINIIKNFCSSLSFGDDGELRKRIVIIHDIDILHRQIQYSLRRLMEIYDTCVFIFTTKNMNKLLDSLHSRCVCYRLPLNTTDISDLFKNMKINKKVEDGISKSLLKLDNAIFHTNHYKTINDFITKKSINIPNVRNALYEILSCNANHSDMIKTILSQLKLEKRDPEICCSVYNLASKVDIMCISGSKDIINLEYFVICCKLLLRDEK